MVGLGSWSLLKRSAFIALFRCLGWAYEVWQKPTASINKQARAKQAIIISLLWCFGFFARR